MNNISPHCARYCSSTSYFFFFSIKKKKTDLSLSHTPTDLTLAYALTIGWRWRFLQEVLVGCHEVVVGYLKFKWFGCSCPDPKLDWDYARLRAIVRASKRERDCYRVNVATSNRSHADGGPWRRNPCGWTIKVLEAETEDSNLSKLYFSDWFNWMEYSSRCW